MRQLKSPPFPALFCGLALLRASQPAHSGEPQSQRVLQAFFASEQGSALSIRGRSITGIPGSALSIRGHNWSNGDTASPVASVGDTVGRGHSIHLALFCGLALLLASQPARAGEPQSQRVLQAFLASEQGSALSIWSIWEHSITVGLRPFCQD